SMVRGSRRPSRGAGGRRPASGTLDARSVSRQGVRSDCALHEIVRDSRGSNTVKRAERSTAFLILFALTIGAFLAENLLYFPLSVPYMKDLAAGAPILDMRPGYTPDAAYHLFEVLGPSGRSTYLRLLWTVDLLLPTLFGVFLWSAIR